MLIPGSGCSLSDHIISTLFATLCVGKISDYLFYTVPGLLLTYFIYLNPVSKTLMRNLEWIPQFPEQKLRVSIILKKEEGQGRCRLKLSLA